MEVAKENRLEPEAQERFHVRFAVRNGQRETVEEAGPYWLDEGEVFRRIRQIQLSLPPSWVVLAEGVGPRSRWRCWRRARSLPVGQPATPADRPELRPIALSILC
ncbi:MAG: hypothetical protein CMH55_05305 [Myxococcales bacterium]|nr:hypothetical protein [Myxococcales bacterium]